MTFLSSQSAQAYGSSLLETIPGLIQQYNDAFLELREYLLSGHLDEPGPFPPVYYQHLILYRLSYLQHHGFPVTDLVKQYEIIDQPILDFLKSHTAEYEQYLQAKVKSVPYIYDLPADYLFTDKMAFRQVIENRTLIDILFHEIGTHVVVGKFLHMDVLRDDMIFTALIPVTIERKTYSPVDMREAPAWQWWRHLEARYGKEENNTECP